MPSLLTFPAFSPALVPGESREELESLLDAYLDEYNPGSITEEHCVCQLVDAEWRLRRLRNAQALMPSSDSTFRTNENHLVNLYNRALNSLLKRRRNRRHPQQPDSSTAGIQTFMTAHSAAQPPAM